MPGGYGVPLGTYSQDVTSPFLREKWHHVNTHNIHSVNRTLVLKTPVRNLEKKTFAKCKQVQVTDKT